MWAQTNFTIACLELLQFEDIELEKVVGQGA
jgi:hypothetical protein